MITTDQEGPRSALRAACPPIVSTRKCRTGKGEKPRAKTGSMGEAAVAMAGVGGVGAEAVDDARRN